MELNFRSVPINHGEGDSVGPHINFYISYFSLLTANKLL